MEKLEPQTARLDTTHDGSVRDVHALVEEHLRPTVIDVAQGKVLVTSTKQMVTDLEAIAAKHRTNPRRATGVSHHVTQDSIVAHIKRHAGPDTVLYCDINEPSLTAVYNATPGGEGRGGWGDHRAKYTLPLSEEWIAWMKAANSGNLPLNTFAELLESRIQDIAPPSTPGATALEGVQFATASALLSLSKGLEIRIEQEVTHQERLDNGTSKMVWSEMHTNARGEALTIPGGFILGIPVFVLGDRVPVSVRLRYTVVNKKLMFKLVPYGASEILRTAVLTVAKAIAKDTGQTLFLGSPEAPATPEK